MLSINMYSAGITMISPRVNTSIARHQANSDWAREKPSRPARNNAMPASSQGISWRLLMRRPITYCRAMTVTALVATK
ncbi:hypothetical protein D3C77_761880 [compost metagenome]